MSKGSETLECLLFKATNPANVIDDVNTIKMFCDKVLDTPDGCAIAAKLLAHKIQSPQHGEALQALAVLEATMKACGQPFHSEVGKYKFLNELIKLLSPSHLADTTPEHIKKRIVEMLYLWTLELPSETKIVEAYHQLKKHGFIKEDPVHIIGKSVFAPAIRPWKESSLLSNEQSVKLKNLLQSRHPEDQARANDIIKKMVREDEKKMESLTQRKTDLVIVNNNIKLLNEMLDHYNPSTTTNEELSLLSELYKSCEGLVKSKLINLASVSHDEGVEEIVEVGAQISMTMKRYKQLVNDSNLCQDTSKNKVDALLDFSKNLSQNNPCTSFIIQNELDLSNVKLEEPSKLMNFKSNLIDDLLGDDTVGISSSMCSNAIFINDKHKCLTLGGVEKIDIQNLERNKDNSRVRGLLQLDELGEHAIRSNLHTKSPQFMKRNEKVPMEILRQKQQQCSKEFDVETHCKLAEENEIQNSTSRTTSSSIDSILNADQSSSSVDLNSLNVSLCSIKPNPLKKPIILHDADDGLRLQIHFGQKKTGPNINIVVVTIVNNNTDESMEMIEFKAFISPKGCKIRLMNASASQLPPLRPFMPPPALSQVMLISKPDHVSSVKFKYILNYTQDGDLQTEVGQIENLTL